MSRVRIPLDDRRELVVGWDRPVGTYFVQLWDRDFDPDFALGAPVKAAGYHDMEKIPPLAGEYGPYPIATPHELNVLLSSWGVPELDIHMVGGMR